MIDFSCVSNPGKFIKIAEDAIKFVSKIKKKKSLLVIVDFSNTKFDNEMTQAAGKMSDYNRQYIKFIAIVGLGIIKSVFYKLNLFLSGNNNHKVFSTKLKAALWLSGK